MRRSNLVLLACALAFAVPALAQPTAPAKPPSRILVGFAAGGTTDVAARLLAEHLKSALHRPVIIDDKPGASGRIAAEALKHAAPDGTALMLAPMVVTALAPLVWPRLDYNPSRDFAPIAQVATYPIALAIGAQLPARTLTEFVAWAKRNPGHANYGTPGAGSLPHLFGVLVGRTTTLDWVHVPYRGMAPMANDLIGGQVSAGFDALSNLIELHRSGKVRIIATSGVSRSLQLPDVPTFKEQGLTAVEGTGWLGMYAPAGTPQSMIDALSAAIGDALRDDGLRKRFIELGLEPTGSTPQELMAITATETARWAPVIKASGLAAD